MLIGKRPLRAALLRAPQARAARAARAALGIARLCFAASDASEHIDLGAETRPVLQRASFALSTGVVLGGNAFKLRGETGNLGPRLVALGMQPLDLGP
jgi:hypothetical protein